MSNSLYKRNHLQLKWLQNDIQNNSSHFKKNGRRQTCSKVWFGVVNFAFSCANLQNATEQAGMISTQSLGSAQPWWWMSSQGPVAEKYTCRILSGWPPATRSGDRYKVWSGVVWLVHLTNSQLWSSPQQLLGCDQGWPPARMLAEAKTPVPATKTECMVINGIFASDASVVEAGIFVWFRTKFAKVW